MMELAQEVERLQQQVESLGRNSQTLRDLVTQVDAFAIPAPPSAPKEVSPLRPPSLPGSKRPSWEDSPGPPSVSGGQTETWARRTIRQSQAIEKAHKQRMIGATIAGARVSGYWQDEGIDDEDVLRVREELLRVQFQRLDSEKQGYLSPAQLVLLAQRFGEVITEEDVQGVCHSLSERRSKDSSRESGLHFTTLCALMAPDEEENGDTKAPAMQALKRALRAEAQERLVAEQERRNLAEKNRMRGFFAMVFDLITVAVIISNALVMGVSTDVDSESTAWDVTEVGFFVFYLLEYLIKLRTQSCRSYYTRSEAYWNWFDNGCLLISFIDLLFTYMVRTAAESTTGSDAFMLVRMLRLARLARLVRLMRFQMFRELKLMVLGLFSGLRALAWAIVLLMFTIYTFGVLMRLTSDLPEFSSMSNSMFTLFRCFVTDGCVSYDGTPLAEKLRHQMGMPFFIMYILTTMIIYVGLFNLIMAVFIDNVLRSQGQRKLREIGDSSAAVCTELKLQFRRFLCENTVATSNRGLLSRLSASAQQQLTSLTSKDDYYSDQAAKKKVAEAAYRILQEDQVCISREMFALWLQDTEFTAMLEEADVDMSDKFRMFDILDVDMGGELSADELVTGLMQLRGDVSKGGIVAIMLKVRHLTYAIEEIQQTLKDFCPAVLQEFRSWKPALRSLG